VLHDCNPPTEYHQREDYGFINSPAGIPWNGTTWKAFYKYRYRQDLNSICFDTDWGVGVISKKEWLLFNNIGLPVKNEFFEFNVLVNNRKLALNLTNFELWTQKLA
jgi:hypothetical protein